MEDQKNMCECKSPLCGMHRRHGALKMLLVILAIYVGVLTIGEIKKVGIIGKDVAPQATIVVSGEGEQFAKPDIATLSYTVRDTKKIVADAQKAVTTKTDSVFAALKALGIADKDVKTISYNINPHYEWNQGVYCPVSMSPEGVAYPCPPGRQVLTGYEVSQSVEVKVRAIDTTGAVLGKLGDLGVTEVGTVSFSIEDEDAVKAKARDEAITKAKDQAQILADQLGVSLARIVSFSESGGGFMPYYMKADSVGTGMATPSAAPSVPTGENRIVSNVTITYEIR